jgi:hypothetical protein
MTRHDPIWMVHCTDVQAQTLTLFRRCGGGRSRVQQPGDSPGRPRRRRRAGAVGRAGHHGKMVSRASKRFCCAQGNVHSWLGG